VDRFDGDYDLLASSIASMTGEDTKGILLFTNAVKFDIEQFIKSCNRYIAHIPIFGGIASDYEPYENFLVFSHNRVFKKEGIVAVLMHGDSLQVNCSHYFDWVPIGKEFDVTNRGVRNR